MKHYQLYYFASCPFCIKVLMGMKFLGVKLPLKNIKQNPQYRAELVEGGGKKQVPCLRIEEEGQTTWLYESSDILRYLKQQKAVAAL